MNPKKILCIQLKQLGDVLMCTPAIRALKARWPEAELHFLTCPPADQLLKHNLAVDRVWLAPKDNNWREGWAIFKQLRAQKFDLVVDIYGRLATALLSRFTGAPVRVGRRKVFQSIFYTHPHHPQASYSAAERLALLEPLGIQGGNLALDFPIGPDDRTWALDCLDRLGWDRTRPLVTLSPVSRQLYKVWPAINFARAIQPILEETGAQLLLQWGLEEEKDCVENLRVELAKLGLEDLGDYPIPNLSQTVALFELADFHLGNDNGPMHFAIAAGCPSLAVFGRPLVENWMPPGSTKHRGLEFDPGCKRKCHYQQGCELECLGTEPAQVMEAFREIKAQHWKARRLETGRRRGL